MMGQNHHTFSAHGPVVQEHLRRLRILAVLLRVLVVSIALMASYLPAFDSSGDILLVGSDLSFFKRWIATSFRWDAFHLLNVAQQSYKYEHEWAFFPGVPLLSNLSGRTLGVLTNNPQGASIYNMILGHFILSAVVTVQTVRSLYLLTLQHTQSPSLSLLSAYLSLLSSSPATLNLAPYAEPWFALLSYKGMLYCAQKRWFLASVLFTLASTFRSNGLLLSGFIIWGMLVEPFIARRAISLRPVPLCMLMVLLPLLPFILHQYSGYRAFCTHGSNATPLWCTRRPPLIYTHVQSAYWNVGFLRYWTLQQLPNFLISSPVLLILVFSSTTCIFRVASSFLTFPYKSGPPSIHPLLVYTLLPHAIHALVITCMLLFASHTQIVLRLASSMPFTYWSAARLFIEHPKWARAWVGWSVVWGAVSVVLWTTFLPPA